MDSRESRDNFLDVFFGPGNDLGIDPNTIEGADPSHNFLKDLIHDVREGSPWPWLLPRRVGDGAQPTWYAIAADYADFRRLGAELAAVTGDPYSDFSPEAASLVSSDPVEFAILSLGANAHAYRFTASPGQVVPLRIALERLHRAWTLRPKRGWVRVRPLGRVLRDFELALAGHKYESAVEAIGEIERNRQLTATNLLFLRFRLAATFEDPRDALNLPDVDTLITIRRPLAVTTALQQIVFDANLVDTDGPVPVDQAIEIFSRDLAQSYGPLFTTLRASDDASAVRLQMLATVNSARPNEAFADEALARPWNAGVRSWLQAVWDRRQQRSDSARTATQNFQLGDLDGAFAVALVDEPSQLRAKILLVSAVSIGTKDAAQSALDAFDALSLEEQGQLGLDGLVKLALLELRERTRFLPSTWADWFDRIAQHPHRETIDLLDEALPGWMASELDSDQGVAALTNLFLATRPGDQMALVADAVPRALTYCQRSGASDTRLAPLHHALLAVLTYESDLTATDLSTISEIAATVLGCGMDESQYSALLRDLLDVWTRVKSWRRCDWAADVLDAVVSSPAPVPAERDAFVVDLYSQLTAYADRVNETQRVLLRLLGREASQPTEIWSSPTESEDEIGGTESSPLSGLTVGIYTLDEGAAATVRGWILEVAPSARVVLNHEHDASERLTAMVRSSDIVVVGWATAKHAATNHIRDVKPDSTQVVMAQGRGATGLFRAVLSAMA
ncbi:protein DpdD [Longivirga aurantiaca]|uniref:Protein DpdD n=1 Tax=Longivirga aurantiaca TaxID=1837743 RepID=A0ABW1T196_9ACTN